jgi:hypothetical protein
MPALESTKKQPIRSDVYRRDWRRQNLEEVFSKVAPEWSRIKNEETPAQNKACIHIRARNPSIHLTDDPKRRIFSFLVDQWYKDTALFSSLSEKISHPSYLRIIKMGDSAVPLILTEMKRRPGHWFSALDILTEGATPAAGAKTLTQATAAWIKWGEDEGYL